MAKSEENRPVINFVEENEVESPKGFLEVQREKKKMNKRKGHALMKELQDTDVTGNEEVGAIKSKTEMIDERLKRHEVQMKNIDNAQFEGGQKAEDDYVNAIKAKISILGKID